MEGKKRKSRKIKKKKYLIQKMQGREERNLTIERSEDMEELEPEPFEDKVLHPLSRIFDVSDEDDEDIVEVKLYPGDAKEDEDMAKRGESDVERSLHIGSSAEQGYPINHPFDTDVLILEAPPAEDEIMTIGRDEGGEVDTATDASIKDSEKESVEATDDETGEGSEPSEAFEVETIATSPHPAIEEDMITEGTNVSAPSENEDTVHRTEEEMESPMEQESQKNGAIRVEEGEKEAPSESVMGKREALFPGEESLLDLREVIDELDIYGKEGDHIEDSNITPPPIPELSMDFMDLDKGLIKDRRRKGRVGSIEDEVRYFVKRSIDSPLLLNILKLVVESGPYGIPKDEIIDEVVEHPKKVAGCIELLCKRGVLKLNEGVITLNNDPRNIFYVTNLLNLWHNPRRREDILNWMINDKD